MEDPTAKTKTYATIVGNPPFVRLNGAIYIDFTENAITFDHDGELVFTFRRISLNWRVRLSCWTIWWRTVHSRIYSTNNEKMFENASIDVMVFRYCKNSLVKKGAITTTRSTLQTAAGWLRSAKRKTPATLCFRTTSTLCRARQGKKTWYKNAELGNIEVLNGETRWINTST
jgi:adenine-specific DNA-methyltransferase